jgi:hypothetical protein
MEAPQEKLTAAGERGAYAPTQYSFTAPLDCRSTKPTRCPTASSAATSVGPSARQLRVRRCLARSSASRGATMKVIAVPHKVHRPRPTYAANRRAGRCCCQSAAFSQRRIASGASITSVMYGRELPGVAIERRVGDKCRGGEEAARRAEPPPRKNVGGQREQWETQRNRPPVDRLDLPDAAVAAFSISSHPAAIGESVLGSWRHSSPPREREICQARHCSLYQNGRLMAPRSAAMSTADSASKDGHSDLVQPAPRADKPVRACLLRHLFVEIEPWVAHPPPKKTSPPRLSCRWTARLLARPIAEHRKAFSTPPGTVVVGPERHGMLGRLKDRPSVDLGPASERSQSNR